MTPNLLNTGCREQKRLGNTALWQSIPLNHAPTHLQILYTPQTKHPTNTKHEEFSKIILPWCVDANEFEHFSLKFVVDENGPVENTQKWVDQGECKLWKQIVIFLIFSLPYTFAQLVMYIIYNNKNIWYTKFVTFNIFALFFHKIVCENKTIIWRKMCFEFLSFLTL